MSVSLRGPERSLLVGNLVQFRRDPLSFIGSCARHYGDVVLLRFLNKRVVLLNNPEWIEEVLVTKSRNFREAIGYRTPFMRRLYGQGLLTSEGEFWTRQRKLSQPAFHRDRIATCANWVMHFTQGALEKWIGDEIRPIHRDMTRLTTKVVTKSLFNSDVSKEIENLDFAVVMKKWTEQWSGLRLLLLIVPMQSSRRFKRAIRELDNFIYRVIRERRTGDIDPGDLLSTLLTVRDEEDGTGMNDEQLRDELVTLLIAGLDTPALALSWSFYLLAKNPDAQDRLAKETHQVLGRRAPALSDLPKLRYAEAVIKETSRLPSGVLA
jgi:cytochrome P450